MVRWTCIDVAASEPACGSVTMSWCTWSQAVMCFYLERVGWGRGKELHVEVSFLSAWVDGMEARHSDVPVGPPLQLLSPLGSGIAILSRMWQKWNCSGWNFNDNLATFAFAFLNHELWYKTSDLTHRPHTETLWREIDSGAPVLENCKLQPSLQMRRCT